METGDVVPPVDRKNTKFLAPVPQDQPTVPDTPWGKPPVRKFPTSLYVPSVRAETNILCLLVCHTERREWNESKQVVLSS